MKSVSECEATAKQKLDVAEVEVQLRASKSPWVIQHLTMLDALDWRGREDLRQRALLEIHEELLWSMETHR